MSNFSPMTISFCIFGPGKSSPGDSAIPERPQPITQITATAMNKCAGLTGRQLDKKEDAANTDRRNGMVAAKCACAIAKMKYKRWGRQPTRQHKFNNTGPHDRIASL